MNAANPGFTATDLNHHTGRCTAATGAATRIRLALLDEHGPTGAFMEDGGVVPW